MYYPSLDITDKLSLYGNFFSDDFNERRRIVTFRMYADLELLVKDAFDNTLQYFRDYINNGIYTVKNETCAEKLKKYTLNSTERANKRDEGLKYIKSKLLEFN